ncbi:hypothetical protein [Ralstonia sp. ASV6]|uniref:hypothetical protein n=1 Tax=Ralstonia sp. ASV6 TaxID=2795124 RepID=UPI0018EA3772|nr:hypothetical protein [Ralstonia sp. ASV6]
MASELIGGFLVEMRDDATQVEVEGAAHAMALLRPVLEVSASTTSDNREIAHAIVVAQAKSMLREDFLPLSGRGIAILGEDTSLGNCESSDKWMLVVLRSALYEDHAVRIQDAIGRIRGVLGVYLQKAAADHADAVSSHAAQIREAIHRMLV